MSGECKTWIVCVSAICITAIVIALCTVNVKVKVDRLAIEKGYSQQYVISSQSYSRVWVKK